MTRSYLNVILEAPSVPGGPLQVANLTESTVTLRWEKSENDGGSPIISYNVSKYHKGTWTKVKTIKPGTTECELKNLQSGEEYNFSVSAKNAELTSSELTLEEPIIIPQKKCEFYCELLIQSLETSVTMRLKISNKDSCSLS